MIERKAKSVRALERGLDVLLELQQQGARSLHELHQQLGLPKATLLRMLVTLGKRGFVWQRLADGAYLPSMFRGPENSRADAMARVAEVASSYLASLSRDVAWPSVLAVPRLDHIEVIETNSPLTRIDTAILGPVGAKLSYVHTATGRAYLAACPPSERAAIIERLRPKDASADSVAALDFILSQTRARGYATRDPSHPWPDRGRVEVARDGRRSIAMPVLVAGAPVASINLTWPAHRSPSEEMIAAHVRRLGRVTEAIGHTLERSEPRSTA